MKRALLVALAAAALSACATTRAEVPMERPPLDVPPPPPRVVEAAPVPQPLPEPVPDLPAAPPSVTPSKPRPSANRETRQSDASKQEAKPETAPQPEAPPPATSPSTSSPPPLLRTPATVDTAGAERQIREILNRARNGLDAVKKTRMSPERRKAFAEANDYMAGAEAAIKSSNFELAKELAEKAEKYSRELQGR